MGKASTTAIFEAPIEKAFKIISDYSNYPQFMSDVKRVSIIESSAEKKLVEFELQIIKTFRYQLWMTEVANSEVTWRFHSGEIFKANSGSWNLKDLEGGRTQAEYTIDAKFGIFVPGMIEKKLIEVNLPVMMKAFKTKIEAK
jgi:coenzyme Q-binding protein COQ10